MIAALTLRAALRVLNARCAFVRPAPE